MFKLTSVCKASLLVCLGSVALAANAQTAPTSELKRVEVTGSRIKRIDAETAAPVQVITREQIERSGATTVTEILSSVPASNTGSFNESAVASFTPGAGGISLRGLGAQATLVLVNGRRVAPFGFASGGQQTFTDTNAIPPAAIERIEILLDGASAIYGSDAMGGVVNIILRKDFTGLRTATSFGQSSRGDGTNPNASVSFGMGSLASDGYNFFVTLSHDERSAIKANTRDNTSTANFTRFGLLDQRSSYSYPGNLYTSAGLAGGTFRAPVAGCTPVADGTALNGRCVYDATAYTDIIPKTNRDSIFLAGTFDLGGGNELFGDLNVVQAKFLQQSPSYSTSTYWSTLTLPTAAIILPVGHPQNPYTTESMIRYRFSDVDRTTDVKSDNVRAVLGVRGDWWGWDSEVAALYSTSKTDVVYNGFIRDSVLLNEVLDANKKAKTTFYFGNPSKNDAGLMSRLYPTLNNNGDTKTASIDVRGSRDLISLDGGMLAIAVGAELRHEEFTSTPDKLIKDGELSVLGASSSDGSRNINAIYAELSAPIFKSVEAQLAVRNDHYSDFGNALTPKASVKWKALPTLALRATYSEGFRAPSLTEIYASPTTGFYSGIQDPKLCPVPSTTNTNCDLSLPAVTGSNPNLKPETSNSWTAGIIFEPADNLSLTFDIYDIKRNNEISGMDPEYLLAHESEYPGAVVRDSSGVIQSLNLQYSNLGSTHVKGYDITIKSSINMGEYGKLGLSTTYNAAPNYLVVNVPGATEVEYAGTYTQPTHRMGAGVDWSMGPWNAGVTWNYVGEYLRAFTPANLTCSYATTANASLCRVESSLITNLYFGYKGFKNLDLGLVVKNLEDTSAPLDERQAGRYTLYNPSFHSAMGRYFQVRASYKFW